MPLMTKIFPQPITRMYVDEHQSESDFEMFQMSMYIVAKGTKLKILWFKIGQSNFAVVSRLFSSVCPAKLMADDGQRGNGGIAGFASY